VSRELDRSSPSKRQASERYKQERDEKGCDHECVVVMRRRRETVERLAVCAERFSSRCQYENGEERPDCSDNRVYERRPGEVEGEQGDRDCAAQAVDPD
jgi:hypothetical protein